MTTSRIVRAIAGIIVLVILLVTVNGWWSEYKKATPGRASTPANSAPAATETVAPAPSETVVILVDGLNFREKPDATGASIRGLKKGEQFVMVSKTGSWLELKDASGKIGWVNNNPQYVRIEKK